MKQLRKDVLSKTPCEICEMQGEKRCNKPQSDYYTCGIYTEIVIAQWDATCKLIRERTGKKK